MKYEVSDSSATSNSIIETNSFAKSDSFVVSDSSVVLSTLVVDFNTLWSFSYPITVTQCIW